MISVTNGAGDEPNLETRNLRSRLRFSTPDLGHRAIARTSNGDTTRTEGIESEQPAKRVKLSQEPPTEPTKAVATSTGSHTSASAESRQNLRDGADALSAKDAGEVRRRTWTLPRTKRASSLNLHNHPVISHPVGIAIWLLQKIDQARKSNASDDERSPSTSLPASPGGIRPSTETPTSGARLDRSDSATAFSLKPSSLTGAQPLWGQSHVNEHEDDTARRQAQRHRKTKQRSENWAKNKENDVVARAKLEAKKKFGTQPQQEMERKKFVDERVRDDYGRLLGRQTAQFADAVAQLAPFRVGHSDKFVESNLPHYGLLHPYVRAGKLVLDVLPALAEPQVSGRSQRAADALLSALDNGSPDEGSFFTFIEVLSDDDVIQRGIDKVLGQLLNARPDDRRASRSQASPAAGQLAPPPCSASPDSAALSLKRLTWKEPTTLKDNSFAQQPNSTPAAEGRATEPPGPQQNTTTPPTQTGIVPGSPSLAYLTPSTSMPPPPPAQSRSSGRERKPSAKILAAGVETPSRQLAVSPPAAARPTLTRNARSVPRVPSKLGLSEIVADHEDSASPPASAVAVPDPHPSSEGTTSSATAANQRSSPPSLTGPPIPPVVPRSLQQPHLHTSPKPEVQSGIDSQLTANLLRLAEIAANMSDSDDDELEMERPDLPCHERLLRILESQSSTSKRHSLMPNAVEQSAKSPRAAPMHSGPSLQTTPINVTPSQPTSLPPVNTIISAKEAQAASSFFKSLATGHPMKNAPGATPTPSATANSCVVANKPVTAASSMQPSNAMTNGIAHSGRLSAVGNVALPTQISARESQTGHVGSNKLSPKTQPGGLNTNGQSTIIPQLHRPQDQAALAHHAAHSPQHTLVPLEKKRKFEDEGNDIAMSRLRAHAESRGLVVDPRMTFDQVNAMIDNHEKASHHSYSGVNGATMPQVSPPPYGNGLATNGNAPYSSTRSSPTIERPPSADGLRRLAPNPVRPGYQHPYSSHYIIPPRSPAAKYPPSPKSFPNPDVQRVLHGHATNTRSPIIQFVPPKQPGQFKSNSSPPVVVVEHPPSAISDDDPRQHHQKALNGGPPGGGAVINSRTSKKQQTTNASNYRFQVNAKETAVAQSQPKRGGQLMTF